MMLAKPSTVCLILLTLLPHPSSANDSTNIVLATGERGGNYFRLGNQIAKISALRGLTVQVLSSEGSVDNIELLRTGKAAFAFVQSDIASRAVRGHKPFREPVVHLVLVTPLFAEAVQILVRSDLYVFTTAELRGKVVSLGPVGSGTEVTARSVFEASGVSVEEIQARNLPLESVDKALSSETVDAVFLSSAIPTPAVQKFLENQEARLILLDSKVIERLAKSGSYVEAAITKRTYPNQPDEVPTIGVQALLLTRDDVPATDISLLLQVLQANRKGIESDAGVRMDLLGTSPPPGLSLPIHPVSRSYLGSGTRFQGGWLALVILLLLLAGFVILNRRRIRHSLAGREKLLLGGVTLASTWLMSAGGLYYYEHNVNENFSTFPKSAWSLLVYVSGGFQSRSPLTGGGELVSVFSIILGIGMVSWFIAESAGSLVSAKFRTLENFLLRRNDVPSHLKDHLIIINWDHRTERMVEQLYGPDFEQRRPIVVLSQEPVDFSAHPTSKRPFAISGDPTDKKILQQAQVQSAHSVTIVSAWRSSDAGDRRRGLDADASDAKTIMTIIAIRTACSESELPKPKQVPITAEIRSSRNIEAAMGAGRDGPTEIVCVENFGTDILTQCALTPGLAGLYQDLLTFAPGSDEIYKIDVPRECVGKTFTEVIHHFGSRYRSKKNAAIPIGVHRNKKVYLNPKDDGEIGPLHVDDSLFVIADNAQILSK